MRTQPLIYNFEYQRKGNTRKSIKGRFAQSDKIKAFWAKNRDNYSDKENPKASKNNILGLRDGVRLINKLNTGYVEIKYTPLVDTSDEVVIDSINPVIDINDSLIEEYINCSTTTIGKDSLLHGLKLIHENQQDRN